MTGDLLVGLTPLFIPSPPASEWRLFGVLPIRAYALCIMLGIAVGYWIARRRWIARGGNPESLESVMLVAVPLGIVGARVYHVITDYQYYFGPDGDPLAALQIWRGGLGIWGAVLFGAVGGLIVCRRRGIRFAALADACAPGILVAQGIGRLGNWFNQELFGEPTTLPWGLEIDPVHRPAGFTQFATFHPTFLYELLWTFAMAAILIYLDRRFTLGRGKVFALYVVLYTLGRFWIEALRIDTVNRVGGFRLNNYTSAIVFVVALAVFVFLLRARPGRETEVDATARPAEPTDDTPGEPPDESGHEAEDDMDDDVENDVGDDAGGDAGDEAEVRLPARTDEDADGPVR